MNKKKRHVSTGLTYFTVIIAALLLLFPIYWMIIISLKSRLDIFSYPPKFFFFEIYDNYKAPFFEDVYFKYLVNSLLIAAGNAAIVMPISLFAAYAFSRYKFYGDESLFFWTLTNRMAPAAIFIIPYYIMYNYMGLLDTHIGLILVYGVFNIPFAVWLLKSFLDGVPKDLDRAALLDGCSVLSVIRRIIIPICKPGIAVSTIMIMLFSWNEFLFASVLTRVNARTLPSGLAGFITVVGIYWGRIAAVATVALIPALILVYVLQRYIIAGLTLGAVRG
ncbi:MAG: carbohydrate ABC transporter permease [Candidatus Bathyarchaeia archaeon]